MLDGSGSSDPEGDSLEYRWSAPGVSFDGPSAATPEGVFPLGATEVTLTVSDGTQEVSDTVVVEVADTTPNSAVVQLSPDVLVAPKHQLVDVVSTVTVSDACDAGPIVPILTSVTSREPHNGMGDGDTRGDIRGIAPGTPDTSFQLRAERSGTGNGRIYTVRYAWSDRRGTPRTPWGS